MDNAALAEKIMVPLRIYGHRPAGGRPPRPPCGTAAIAAVRQGLRSGCMLRPAWAISRLLSAFFSHVGLPGFAVPVGTKVLT